MATSTKTIIQQLESKHRDWVAATTTLYNAAINFYFEILQGQEASTLVAQTLNAHTG